MAVRAIQVQQWGGPDQLLARDVPDPSAGPGEVLVELRCAALNWHDVIIRSNRRGLRLPRILGADGAGVRTDTGERVVLLPILGWGDSEHAPAAGNSILGDVADGTYAELVVVPAANVFPAPVGWSWSQCAALPVAALTAYRALFTKARLSADQTVLIAGAGSGVSTTAISLAVHAGANVIVTSSSTAKLSQAQQLGAHAGVLYTATDWVEQVRHLSNGGVDVVLDGVGSTINEHLRCLIPGGRLIAFGSSGATKIGLDIPGLYFAQHEILGSTLGSPREFTALLDLVAHSSWRPVIDSEHPLAQANRAHERLEGREHFGKLVLVCS